MPNARIATAASVKRPVKRLVAIIFGVALCFCAICGKVLLDARQAAWEHATQVASSLISTLESDIARNIESYDLSLRAVIDNLAYPEITKISPQLRQLVLFDRSATAKHLDAITLLDEQGIVRLDSRMPFPAPVSRASRSYFQFHKDSVNSDLHISEPIATRENGTKVMVISRRLVNPDGSFAGVVAGSMRLSYIEQLFKNAALGPSGNITLSHADGTLLMRWPHREAMLGSNLKGGELYRRLATARAGQFESKSVTDGIHRLVVYSQVGDFPLVIGVGQSPTDIYAQWRTYASTIGLVMLLLCATSVALALYLAREMWRRNAAEEALAVLAATDGLTGLSNRRRLKEAFDREWLLAMCNKTPLALVMCDADLFKNYNDRHGHQAGDLLLQAIGMAMKQSLRLPSDVAARYGGDEFAILLAGASAENAATVAEQIRWRLAEICDQMEIAPLHLSIGIASVVPRLQDDQNSLMAMADEALYRAKALGRDRIEIAPSSADEPEPAVRRAAA